MAKPRRHPSQRPAGLEAKAAAGEPPRTGDVVQDLSIWDQFFRVGATATPEVVSSIIQEADGGHPARLVDLAHELREKDGHVHACLTTFELAVSSLPWQAVPQSSITGRIRKSEEKLAKQVEAAIRACNNWSAMLAHLVGEAEQLGYATSELKWERYAGRDSLLSGWFLPTSAKQISNNRFAFHRDTSALLFDSGGRGDVERDGLDLLGEFPAGKFVQHRPRINGDVAVREGVARLIAWLGIFRNKGLRGWLLEAENAWKPTRLIEFLKTASVEDVELAKRLARTLTTTGGAAHPETVKPKVEYPKSSGGSSYSRFRDLEEWLGMELSKAILGHTLLLESGTKGARSLGEVGYQLAETRRDARAIALATTINALYIRPLVAYNVGSTKRAPLLLPETKSEIDLAAFAAGVDMLAKRMRIGARWVREQCRIPEPAQDEEILTMGAANGPADGAEDDGADDGTEDDASASQAQAEDQE